MVLKVIGHLAKVVRQTLEVDRFGRGTPAEMIVRLLVVSHLDPEV